MAMELRGKDGVLVAWSERKGVCDVCGGRGEVFCFDNSSEEYAPVMICRVCLGDFIRAGG